MAVYFLASIFLVGIADVRSGPRWNDWLRAVRRTHLKEHNAAVLAYVVAGLLLAYFLVLCFSVLVVHRAKGYAEKKRKLIAMEQRDRRRGDE